ncbi:MAG: S-layer homology domain-containing protein [Butyricicoccus sp.]|nr:S-layer homology domain-containing protein [Butyricicoccus sp.]
MKKRLLGILLAVCLLCPLCAGPTFAAGEETAVQTVRALGIMNGDGKGNMNLDQNVTRAQLAKMLAAASPFKDSIGESGSGYSLFKDVKSSHWASEYIRLAVQQGWMVGYTDGTFRPENPIKLEEACAAVLRVLGYDSSMLAGSFPSAQLNKASALGLRDDISTKQGSTLSRRDCAVLFYNMLNAKNGTGQYYAMTLGYSMVNGEVDYTSAAMENLSGPYVAGGSVSLPFTPLTVYRNGKAADSAAINQYDVYYYNQGLATLWVFTNRASGKIDALSPGSTSPTAVTVSGRTYVIGSSSATYKLSALSGDAAGRTVTLLLGMDDKVVDVLTGAEVNAVYYGVVSGCRQQVDDRDNAVVQTSVDVTTTDGVSRSFTLEGRQSYSAGSIVSVNVTDSGVRLSGLAKRQTSGRVNADGSRLGERSFAANVEILDVDSLGGAVTVKPGRLAGRTLESKDVSYYGLNAQGEIEYLILNDATGDLWTYAYMSEIDDRSKIDDRSLGMNIAVNYTFVTGGREQTIPNSSTKYPVAVGGVAISFDGDGGVRMMKKLSEYKLSSLGAEWAMADNQRVAVADNVQVYLRDGSSYYLTDVSSVNAQDYTLTGWRDPSGSAGGLIRVVIAVKK